MTTENGKKVESKKKLTNIQWGCIAIFVIIAAISMLSTLKGSIKKIFPENVNNYVSYTFEGTDGYGSVSTVFDFEKAKNLNDEVYNDVYNTFLHLNLDPYFDLKNGDKIRVTCSYPYTDGTAKFHEEILTVKNLPNN